MKLVVVSHKECWADKSSPSGYSTIGGFPQQIKALSELFDQTTIISALFKSPMPEGAMPLSGNNLTINPLPAPSGKDFTRKISLLFWLPRNLPLLIRAIRKADAVHTPVPGDIGTLGILIALAMKKRLLIRHCGTWGINETITQRFLNWLLPRIAGAKNIVLATGGGNVRPCIASPDISWIFATTITEREWQGLFRERFWRKGDTLRLVTVSRLEPGKNTVAVVKALPKIKKQYKNTILNVVGGGPCEKQLKGLVAELKLEEDVKFYGSLKHEKVIKVLLESDLFVFPTFGEGFPKVVTEALSCGLPVASSNVSVIPFLIGRDKGVIIDRTDAAAVAEAVLKIIENEEKYLYMSKKARLLSRTYTLENWQEIIRERLTEKWGPLRDETTQSNSDKNPIFVPNKRFI